MGNWYWISFLFLYEATHLMFQDQEKQFYSPWPAPKNISVDGIGVHKFIKGAAQYGTWTIWSLINKNVVSGKLILENLKCSSQNMWCVVLLAQRHYDSKMINSVFPSRFGIGKFSHELPKSSKHLFHLHMKGADTLENELNNFLIQTKILRKEAIASNKVMHGKCCSLEMFLSLCSWKE